jgi:hypothetical protein
LAPCCTGQFSGLRAATAVPSTEKKSATKAKDPGVAAAMELDGEFSGFCTWKKCTEKMGEGHLKQCGCLHHFRLGETSFHHVQC